MTKSRVILVGLALLATAGMSACSANRAPSIAGPGMDHTTSPAATGAASPSPDAPSATPGASGNVQNLVVSAAVRSELTAAYVAYKGIQLSDVAGASPMPASVYYAYDPATESYWAMASFEPSSTAPLSVQVAFQDGARSGMFRKVGTRPWQVQITLNPVLCGELKFFPPAVLAAWALPTAPPAGGPC